MSARPVVPSARLVVDGRPVAPVEVATTRRARRVGLLGRTSFDGALWLPRTRSVHTVGMAMTIDVAILDARGTVVHRATLPPGRVLIPRRGGRTILEAPAGALDRWGAKVGSGLRVH